MGEPNIPDFWLYFVSENHKIARLMGSYTFGAIDIGSNAIRLLITTVEEYPDQVEFKKSAFLRVPIRLGEDVFTQGAVSDQKRERMCEAMEGFAHIMRAYGVQDYRAYATSAMREAKNGPEITDYIRQKSGIAIEIISGQLEADTIFANGLVDILAADKTYLYVDVGGGSTEVIVYSNRTKVEARSFALGTVRILSNAVDKEEMKRFKKWLSAIGKKYQPTTIIGSGGNINKAQKLLNKKDRENITRSELDMLYRYIKSFSFAERVHTMRLATYRADVIVPAMKLFLTVCNQCGIEEIVVPKMGLSDGIIRTLYTQHKGSGA